MNISNKTILITGGGSGIGFEIAKQLSAKGNKVIITGRNADRLKEAAAQLGDVDTFAFDVTSAEDTDKLVAYLAEKHPALDVLINNAGQAFYYNLATDANTYEKASAEMLTNFTAILRLTDKLLPGLKARPEAAIVNVSSILGLAPHYTIPTYSASKAALHAYTQSLRYSLLKNDSTVKVFELMPPLVNTDFSKEIGGENGIPASQVATELLQAFETDTYEVHVGGTADFYKGFFANAEAAFAQLNSRGE
ncbi:SDR family oxidoreductase [Mucilaginibacter pedocola]|uniref:Short-chain dehydrogenase n=1 Tax=Mucilaginibacter pedocola TaxID=1792845 RepID=A0A1S9P998_9SPHI|nr:SDR family NAD(P)-dependent oxidoreductase [Mucilaginibacter pedocola]OOQ57556.1 short-chain dehydrogenase [Mucilaginibacter pedocola]